MFTLGIPNSQQRRANSVLTHTRSTPIEYEVYKQDKDFHIFTFDVDFDGFHDIVLLLKSNGISTIGADEQLTEKNIMRLTNLIEQTITGMEKSYPANSTEKPVMVDVNEIERILRESETKKNNNFFNTDLEYAEFFIEELKDLINDSKELKSDQEKEDEKEDFYSDLEDVSDVNESYQLKDFFINENVETLMVKLGGDEKTELKISNQTDSNGSVDLSNVTLEFKGEKYEGLEFKLEDILEDHGNEGKDALFVAESDNKTFEVEVNIDANYDSSGIIEDVEWRSLETFPKEMNEAHCTEQEIAEGTCGYGMNGDLGDDPAGPDLIAVFEKVINNLKK